mmetsp:Transcript_34416/g.103708  ORF Transcript_34416/g.103708 Transcript_34416/m.103708 type:complete len:156 (-) Transcript_34416:27-494(-)
MSPPIHVKVIACVVNTFVLIAGVRNIAAPGVVVPVIPEDAAFRAHFHPEPGYFSADDQRMAFVFQLLGVGFVFMALSKFVCVFTTPESTYLRQKLFAVAGLCDLAMASVVYMYDGLPKSVTGGFAAMHAAEGLVLLVDAAFRPRPVKAAAAIKKR